MFRVDSWFVPKNGRADSQNFPRNDQGHQHHPTSLASCGLTSLEFDQCWQELENTGRLDSCSPLILVFGAPVESLKKKDVVAALTEAADSVLSLTVVHFCQCHEDVPSLHPLILGDADPLNLPSHITAAAAPGKGDLYLCDADAAATWLVLDQLQITAVVNASQGPNHFPEHLRYFSVDVADSPEEDLLSHVDDVVYSWKMSYPRARTSWCTVIWEFQGQPAWS